MKKKKDIKEESGAGSFMSGVMVLSLSTLLVKIIGLAFKIPMLSFLGTEGMGYFNSAYEIYALLCVVSTAGLPVALSMLVSAARARGDGGAVTDVYKTARALFLSMGLLGSAAMLLLSSQISELIGNSESYYSILAIAPALLFICLASAVRGYCQGFGDMRPTAISQLIEALSKLGLGILFAVIAIKRGYSTPAVSAFAVFGITVGALLSLVYLCIARRSHVVTKGRQTRSRETLGPLLKIAFPVTVGSLIMGCSRIIDMALIMRRLQDAGGSAAEANKIYGAYTTLAVPVFSLIPALIAPIAMALIPELSSHIEKGDAAGQGRTVGNAMRLTALFSMPAALGLAAFSRPVLELLFYGQREAIDTSAPLLSVLGISVVFSCIISTASAILQSYGHASFPIVSMAIGILIKLAVSYTLIGDSRFGAMGAPIGSLACAVTVGGLDLWYVCFKCGVSLSIGNILIKPLLSSLASVGGGLALYIALLPLKMGALGFLISAFAVLLLYIALSLCFGSLGVEDIALLPCGSRILKGRKIKNKRGTENDGFGKEEGTFK